LAAVLATVISCTSSSFMPCLPSSAVNSGMLESPAVTAIRLPLISETFVGRGASAR
jgi:hypothetical protein